MSTLITLLIDEEFGDNPVILLLKISVYDSISNNIVSHLQPFSYSAMCFGNDKNIVQTVMLISNQLYLTKYDRDLFIFLLRTKSSFIVKRTQLISASAPNNNVSELKSFRKELLTTVKFNKGMIEVLK